MSNQKEAFEKFMGTNKAILMVSMCRTGDRFERDVAELAWQSAQADQAATIAQLQLDNERMREALEFYKGFSDSRISSIAQTALHNLVTKPVDYNPLNEGK